MTDSPAEALRRRSTALVLIVGYPQSGWSVSTRREPSGPLWSVSGHSIDDCCAKLLQLISDEPPAPAKRKLVRRR